MIGQINRAAELALSHQRLTYALSYDPETGYFTWAAAICKKVVVGRRAGNLSPHGYIRISIDRASFQAHRLAFFYMTGKWPERLVDHRNAIRNDNRWTNLREASDEINLQNQRSARSNNKSGLLGVTAFKGKFIARIKVAGRQIRLGQFGTPEAAHRAYLEAKRKLHKGNTL